MGRCRVVFLCGKPFTTRMPCRKVAPFFGAGTSRGVGSEELRSLLGPPSGSVPSGADSSGGCRVEVRAQPPGRFRSSIIGASATALVDLPCDPRVMGVQWKVPSRQTSSEARHRGDRPVQVPPGPCPSRVWVLWAAAAGRVHLIASSALLPRRRGGERANCSSGRSFFGAVDSAPRVHLLDVSLSLTGPLCGFGTAACAASVVCTVGEPGSSVLLFGVVSGLPSRHRPRVCSSGQARGRSNPRPSGRV